MMPSLLADSILTDWPATTLYGSLLHTALYGLLGILLAVIGFKIFDWLTPGDLQKEVIENKNVAAAVVVGSFLVGICYIIAIAVHG